MTDHGGAPQRRVAGLLHTYADHVQPDLPDIERILSGGRRRRRLSWLAAGAVVIVVLGGVAVGINIVPPSTHHPAQPPVVTVDQRILRAVNGIGGTELDPHAYRLQYVPTTNGRAAPLFDNSLGQYNVPVIVAVAQGHYSQTHVPPGHAIDTFGTLVVLFDRHTMTVMAWGTRGRPVPEATLSKLGRVTDCTLRYPTAGPTSTCRTY